jgi:hypothetical protein
MKRKPKLVNAFGVVLQGKGYTVRYAGGTSRRNLVPPGILATQEVPKPKKFNPHEPHKQIRESVRVVSG